MPIRQYVHVRNVDNIAHTIFDRRFSGGKLTLGPGEEYDLANDIWMDHRRRHQAWLKDTHVLEQQAQAVALAEAQAVEAPEEEQAAEEPAVEEVAKDQESVESEVDQPITETEPEVEEEQPAEEEEPAAESEPEKDLADYTMKELREKAAKIGMKIPVGTSRIDAAKMIQAAGPATTVAEEGKNDDEN